jgi:mannose/fructose-specific phosphotransferase system component IIA
MMDERLINRLRILLIAQGFVITGLNIALLIALYRLQKTAESVNDKAHTFQDIAKRWNLA